MDKKEILDTINKILSKGILELGPEVEKFEKSLFWAYFASKRSKISQGGLDRSVLVYRFQQKKNFLKISIFGRFRSNLPNLAQFLKNQEKCYKIAKMTFFRNLKVLFEAP